MPWINVCTAPAPVLESLAVNLGEYTEESLAIGRKTGCFPDATTFGNILGGATAIAKLTGKYATKSQYFRLTTRVTLGTTEFTLYSLLLRGNGGKITPLLRSFGTL